MIGETILNYKIVAQLGEGGMGKVYRATDITLGRDVAIKMLHTPLLQQAQSLERFRKEARVLAQLLHPNIAVIYNFMEQHGSMFMIMEYVEGSNLEDLLRKRGTLSAEIVVPVMIQALEGLRHAHRKGVFHRDIKPSNLMLTPEGTIKLMDFGIARVAGEQRLTKVNSVVGTLEYLAPELIQGEDPSEASDLYAMGIMMYEMLSGQPPFSGKSDYTLMQDILKKKSPPPERLNANVPKSLSAIVMKAIEKKPSSRFKDAKEFSQALTNAFPQHARAELGYLLNTPAPPVTKIVRLNLPAVAKTAASTRTVSRSGKIMKRVSGAMRLIGDKAMSRSNRPAIAVVLSVLLVTLLGLRIYKSNNNGEQIVMSAGVGEEKVNNGNDQSEKNERERNESRSGSGDYGTEVRPPVYGNEGREPGERSGENENENEKEKEKEKERGSGKRGAEVKGKEDEEKKENENEEKNGDENEKQKEEEEEIKKEETVPEPEKKTRAVKTIQLKRNLNIPLYLNQVIDPETAREGQQLGFTVSGAVYYDGELIFERGATASGFIKTITRKKISIVFTSVTTSGGRKLSLGDFELSGRFDDMLSGRNYSVIVKRGTPVTF